MRNLDIETSLRSWIISMVNRYDWLTIRFEYNDTENRFLVSYYYAKSIDDNDSFYTEALSFEDKMNELYSDDAPLFCDLESLFKLSPMAEVFHKPSYSECFLSDTFSFKSFTENGSDISISQTSNNEYALAA